MLEGARPTVAVSRGLRRVVPLLLLTFVLSWPHAARADDPKARPATLEWSEAKDELRLSVTYRDALDASIRRKLSRGLPTTIVLTGTAYRPGADKPVSTTVQSCKITWHVWNEAYRVEITRPDRSHTSWTTTLEGVLRRCAEARDLPLATRDQIPIGVPVLLKGKVQINPISPEILEKIRRWVSRPVRTGTAAPGDALFSTFTGLSMQRVGEAERSVEFVTTPAVPTVEAPKKAPKNEG
jgi:hypothetical protein